MTEQIKPQQENDNTPKEVGIASVAGTKKRSGSDLTLFLMVLLATMLVAGIAFGFYQKSQKASKASAQQESVTLSFSSKALTVPPLSEISPPEPLPVIEEPKAEEKPKIAKAPEAKFEPEPIIAQPPQITPATQNSGLGTKEEKREPTLEEKRNMAPMMGESSTITTDTDGKGKGLAATFREEGYASGAGSSGGKLGGLLSSVSTPSTKAGMMQDRNLLLPKGAFIDCILETKLDTTVPGMTSCVLPRDVYSANGKVLLLERGSKAIGEYKGAVENGLNRIFVLWTQIQTPKGVRINLDSPATDSLGGSGMAGNIDFHWWARFGNALLFTLIEDGFDFAMTKQTENNGGVNYYQNSQDGMEEIIREAMRQSGNIPPTLTKNQGERVGIFVARDVDFSSVYRLKPIQ